MKKAKGLYALAAIVAVIAVMSACEIGGSGTNDPGTNDPGTGIHEWGDWERVGVHPTQVTRRTCTLSGCSETQTITFTTSRVQASPITGLAAGMRGKEMALIPAGSIMTLTQDYDFWMSQHQITRAQWYAVMGTTPWTVSWGAGTPANDVAVTDVSWFNAIEFANRLSIARGLTPVYSIPAEAGGAMTTYPDLWGSAPTSGVGADFSRWIQVQASATANGYRLPTSAQWEYAARAGTTTHFNDGITNGWTTTADLAAIDLLAWTNRNSASQVRIVGQLRPNAWGLYDMDGNVREWCWYAFCTFRVLSGGSWNHDANNARSSNWNNDNPWNRWNNNGFRLVRL